MLTIRRGKPEDSDQVQELLTKVWEDDYVPHMWLDWVKNPDKGIVLVALDQGAIIGTTYIAFCPGNACWFQALRVHPHYRRRGVGSRLTKVSIAESKKAGREVIYLGIDEDNIPSLKMTESLGFKRTSQFNRFAKKLAHKSSDQPTRWRPATGDDLETIFQDGKARDVGELLLCWQWQPFSKEALQDNIRDGHLSVWGAEQIQVWGGLEIYEELQIFVPIGAQEDVQQAINDAEAYVANKAETWVEIWLPHLSPLAGYLLAQGYTPDDGYVIWTYHL